MVSKEATAWLCGEAPPITGMERMGEFAVEPEIRIVLPVRTARQ
jgi:hypothetical protein